jgi:glutamate decarboxylase
MVHLAAIPTDEDIQAPTISGHSLEKLKLENIPEDDDNFTTIVYGSKYAVLDLPKYEMPDEPMPKEVAYRMIKYVPVLKTHPLSLGKLSAYHYFQLAETT